MGSISASFFGDLAYIPPDPIFQLTKDYNADSFPQKVNLGQGTYKDEEGNPWVLPAVSAAKERLHDENHEYLPILGLASFRRLAGELVLGKESKALSEQRVATCQALSGTGALHLAGTLLLRAVGAETPVYITEPTWSNHRQVFSTIGFNVHSYPYYSPKTGKLDLPQVLQSLENAPAGSIFVLHACAHNPSGCDPTPDEWKEIASIMKRRGLFPLFDAAYLGMTSGSYDQDAFAIRYFIEEMSMEVGICSSFAKNMGLYGERVGALLFVTRSTESARATESVLEQLNRGEISNPPAFGARIAATILGDVNLREQWSQDLITMSSRIAAMRRALLDELHKLDTPGNWQHVVDQRGMFCILGLSGEQVRELKEKYHIYMAGNSRISIAGLNGGNVAYVASSIDRVVR